MLKSAIPIIHVASSAAAEAYYCGKLGFQQRFAYRPFGSEDPCYMSLARDGAVLHLSSFSGDSVAGIAVNLLVDDVDALHAEFASAGVAIAMAPTDQTWGNREMYLKDPDGNSIRFVQPRPD
jgi:uncharacterized glyoxalase superfamily protein PhnB